MKILVVEDDAQTRAYLKRGLTELGHVVDVACGGRDGLFLASNEPYDILVIDRMLPELDGTRIVSMIRALGVRTPVLMLTTMGGIDDRVAGLDAGADDYLVKPFAFAELKARITALGRRPALAVTTARLEVGDLEMDLLAHSVVRAGQRIELQPREFRLLEQLMLHAGQIVTRTMLLEKVWDFHFDPRTNIVESHVSRLRARIDRPFRTEMIHTVRGAGYCLRAADEHG